MHKGDGKHRGGRPPVNVDDIDDELLEPDVPMEVGFPKVVVVDNIPIVPSEKYDKLKSVLSKIFSSVGPVKEFILPQDAEKVTKGYAFIEYTTQEAAE
jgi:translation initiation factor 3 subunit B